MWLIHGERYDLTPLLRDHPGGEHILRLTEGTDVSALFETYHAFSDAPRDLLSRYGPAYVGKGVDPMHEETRRSVRGVFGSRWSAKTPPLVLAALLGAQASAMAVMIYSRSDLAAVAFGLVLGTCAARTVHAASHYNAVRSPRANEMLGELIGCIMGMPYGVWLLGHVLCHHPHTNGPLDVDTHLFRGPRWFLAPLPVFTGAVLNYVASAWQSAFVGVGYYRARAVARSVVATFAFHAAMWVLVRRVGSHVADRRVRWRGVVPLLLAALARRRGRRARAVVERGAGERHRKLRGRLAGVALPELRAFEPDSSTTSSRRSRTRTRGGSRTPCARRAQGTACPTATRPIAKATARMARGFWVWVCGHPPGPPRPA
jgi:hypothetical protein